LKKQKARLALPENIKYTMRSGSLDVDRKWHYCQKGPVEPRQRFGRPMMRLRTQKLQSGEQTLNAARRRPYLRLFGLALLLMLLLLADTPARSSKQGSGSVTPCPVILTTQNTAAASEPPLYLGLDAYRHWDKLAYLELGDRVEGEATADLAGSNADSSHILRVLPDGRHVLFDQTGPGIVTFLRMQEARGGPWQLALDGQAPLTIAASDLGQMQPTSLPAQAFPYPLSLNPQQSQGSSLLMTALPFQQSLQWIAQKTSANFYALYRKLPYGTPVQTWTDQAAPADILALLRCVDRDPVAQGLAHQQGTLSLTSGISNTVTTLAGPSQIRALSFRVPFAEMAPFGNARLQIYWDGETRPSVDTPVKFLAGDGAGVYQPANRPLVNSWLTNIGGDGRSFMNFNLYWPMPFAHSARIVLSAGQTLSDIAWSVYYEPFLDPVNWWGTFHANYISVPHPDAGQDMTLLDVQGSGKLVGTVINFTRPGPTLEGDPHIYLDDSQTPQIAVTGTEEWGLGGDYWHNGQQVSLPLGGLPSSSNNPPGTDHDGAALYRYLIADSIPYNRHLLVRWEHGGEDQSPLPYRAALFWYGTPTQTAQMSDAVWPAQVQSRASHAYRASHEQIFALTAAYEETVQSPLSSASVASTTGTTSFTLALNPKNVGAFLRRTFDSCIAEQRADVLIDGQFAGTWYDAGVSSGRGVDGHPRCWRDEDFPLPVSLTRGKTSVTVSLRFIPTSDPQNSVWTARDYLMYSFVLS
jgi:hypothetical protein